MVDGKINIDDIIEKNANKERLIVIGLKISRMLALPTLYVLILVLVILPFIPIQFTGQIRFITYLGLLAIVFIFTSVLFLTSRLLKRYLNDVLRDLQAAGKPISSLRGLEIIKNNIESTGFKAVFLFILMSVAVTFYFLGYMFSGILYIVADMVLVLSWGLTVIFKVPTSVKLKSGETLTPFMTVVQHDSVMKEFFIDVVSAILDPITFMKFDDYKLYVESLIEKKKGPLTQEAKNEIIEKMFLMLYMRKMMPKSIFLDPEYEVLYNRENFEEYLKNNCKALVMERLGDKFVESDYERNYLDYIMETLGIDTNEEVEITDSMDVNETRDKSELERLLLSKNGEKIKKLLLIGKRIEKLNLLVSDEIDELDRELAGETAGHVAYCNLRFIKNELLEDIPREDYIKLKYHDFLSFNFILGEGYLLDRIKSNIPEFFKLVDIMYIDLLDNLEEFTTTDLYMRAVATSVITGIKPINLFIMLYNKSEEFMTKDRKIRVEILSPSFLPNRLNFKFSLRKYRGLDIHEEELSVLRPGGGDIVETLGKMFEDGLSLWITFEPINYGDHTILVNVYDDETDELIGSKELVVRIKRDFIGYIRNIIAVGATVGGPAMAASRIFFGGY